MYLKSPEGLILGLISVAFVQLCIVIPYYWLIRNDYIKRPSIHQLKNKDKVPVSFMEDLKKHLTNPEGFLLLSVYLSGTWIFGLMPNSYYLVWDSKCCYVDVLLQLLINDFYQTIAHIFEHKIKKIYRYSHKSHHKHIRPTLFDAFDGGFLDTMFMILIPLYFTQLTMEYVFKRDVSVWSYMTFGSIYANYLCLIHSEYEHPWDWFFTKLGIGTPADHHQHHKLFNKNYGHIFMYWDKILGTYIRA